MPYLLGLSNDPGAAASQRPPRAEQRPAGEPNRAQSDQLLTQAEAHLRSAQMLRDADTAGFGWMRTTRNATEYGSERTPSATAVDVDEAIEMATTIHQRAGRVLDHMYPY